MKEEKIVESKVKCPKCKHGNDLILIEVWIGHEITWEQINGKFDRNDGNLNPGDAYRVEAECKCGHHWKIKKAIQIDEIVKD